jgi:hypothetical protein
MHAGDRQSFMLYPIPQSSKSLCDVDRVCANIHWFSELCDENAAAGRQHAMRLKERTRVECLRSFGAIR